jgi:hypothetical protein
MTTKNETTKNYRNIICAANRAKLENYNTVTWEVMRSEDLIAVLMFSQLC